MDGGTEITECNYIAGQRMIREALKREEAERLVGVKLNREQLRELNKNKGGGKDG